MIQNPYGRRNPTPTDTLLEQIRDALGTKPAPQSIPDSGLTNLIISLGSPFYIGAKMRFVALSDGAALEVQDSGGTWIEQTRWTET